MGGISKRGRLLKERSSSDCRTYSSDLKEWILLPLGAFLSFVQTSIKASATLSLFVPHGCEGGKGKYQVLWRGLRNTFNWGPINTKGQQEGPRVLYPLIVQRVGQEPEAARSCPPANRPSRGQYEDGLVSGSQIMGTWALKGLSWEMPGVQHLETWGPCLKSQPLLLGKGSH